MQVYAKNYANLKLKVRKNKNAHWYIVTARLLKPLKQYLIYVTLFRISKSLYS